MVPFIIGRSKLTAGNGIITLLFRRAPRKCLAAPVFPRSSLIRVVWNNLSPACSVRKRTMYGRTKRRNFDESSPRPCPRPAVTVQYSRKILQTDHASTVFTGTFEERWQIDCEMFFNRNSKRRIHPNYGKTALLIFLHLRFTIVWHT